MKGLLLTHYYLVYRTLWMYVGLSVVVSAVLLVLGGESSGRLAAMMTILFVVMPALEVIKIEAKTGYDKYVLTLPVNRQQIVRSHYAFFFGVALFGALVSYVICLVHSSLFGGPSMKATDILTWGLFIVLFAGSVAFPLLYRFGADKSDSIVLGGSMGGLFVLFALQGFFAWVIERSDGMWNPDLVVALGYTGIGLLLYGISYSVGGYIYRRREF